MKKILFLGVAATLLVLSACSSKSEQSAGSDATKPEQVSPELVNNPATASGEVKNAKLPKFSFDETSFDFGTINSGKTVTHVFKYKNVGDADLLISEAKGSCGCTIPEYTKAPVKAGETGEIKVTFHSEGMSGQIAKTITILANTIPNTKVLSISAEVLKK
jgi:hypothetical protein